MAGPLYFPAPNATLGTAALMTVDPISDVSRHPVPGRSRLVVPVLLIVTLAVDLF